MCAHMALFGEADMKQTKIAFLEGMHISHHLAHASLTLLSQSVGACSVCWK